MFRGSKTRPTYLGDHRILLKTAEGFKLFVDSRDLSLAPHLILDGVWEEWTAAVLRRLLRPGMIAIEVGANVGYFTLLMSRAVARSGRVFAFECDPELAAFARDNIEINGLHQIAQVQQIAVSDRVGRTTFYRADRHRGCGSLIADLEQLPHNATDQRVPLDVETTTIDEFVQRSGVQPDLLKIDAEGVEAAILRGGEKLLRSQRPFAIVLEFFPRFFRAAGADPAELLSQLQQRGFTLHAIDERRRRIEPTDATQLLARDSAEIVLLRGRRA